MIPAHRVSEAELARTVAHRHRTGPRGHNLIALLYRRLSLPSLFHLSTRFNCHSKCFNNSYIFYFALTARITTKKTLILNIEYSSGEVSFSFLSQINSFRQHDVKLMSHAPISTKLSKWTASFRQREMIVAANTGLMEGALGHRSKVYRILSRIRGPTTCKTALFTSGLDLASHCSSFTTSFPLQIGNKAQTMLNRSHRIYNYWSFVG